MTPEQVYLIQSSWNKVVPIKEAAAEIFYSKLFAADPSVKPLFKGDMKEQGRKLMMMLNTVVTNLDKLDGLVPAVQDLGKRHVGYGVKPEHFDTVGASLLATLKEGLGVGFTPDVEEAWATAYTTLATVMKDTAYS